MHRVCGRVGRAPGGRDPRPWRWARCICRLECTAFAAELVALRADAILAHGAGPVECCKTIFAAQNNNMETQARNIDSITEHSERALRSSLARSRPHFRNRAAKKRL